MSVKTPWLKNYGDVRFNLEYPKATMSEHVLNIAKTYPDNIALSFFGRNIKYSVFENMIHTVAKSFAAIGIKKGDCVTLCMPNVPQTVYSLYALNLIGAVVSVIHPLSSEEEIIYYLKETESNTVVTLDLFYEKINNVKFRYKIDKLIVSSISDEFSLLMSIGFKLTKGRKIQKPDFSDDVISWSDFVKLSKGFSGKYQVSSDINETAVILFSGGTTGVSKGVELTNYNFNCLAYQTVEMSHENICGKSMLAAMPMFHGFGLGVCVHTMLSFGGCSILVPRFTSDEYVKLIKSNKPNFIAGVPTLFEAICSNKALDGVDLSFLKGVFSGGDTLPVDLKIKFDNFLKQHGSSTRIREGYGTTECVTASCLTPYINEKEGSIGFPFPDTYYKICELGTTQEADYGQFGEICIAGPTVMKGYLNHPEETTDTLEKHQDGLVWLRTGDLGCMDADGYVYFKQRIKRMIITSGYNVYPSQIENILNGHKSVFMSCVIGVPDKYKIQKVKAFVVLNKDYEPDVNTKNDIIEYCKKHIAKYAMPYDIEFRESLPTTKVGKIAYGELEKEVIESIKE